jgi:hypothetical protein
MRYALLAPACGYPVKVVALYLARYGMLLNWELTDLWLLNSPATPSISATSGNNCAWRLQ